MRALVGGIIGAVIGFAGSLWCTMGAETVDHRFFVFLMALILGAVGFMIGGAWKEFA